MVDFSNLAPLHVSGDTLAEYVFGDIPGEPSVWLAPATDANPEFLSERVRISVERAEKAAQAPRGGRKSNTVTAEDLEEQREIDRKLLSQTCARKWGTAPVDAKGATPEFTTDNCYDFFKAMPAYMFDPLRSFAANPLNFVQRQPVTPDDARSLGNG